MLIAEFVRSSGVSGDPLRFGVIGTCRVHNPMRCMIDDGRIRMVWRGYNAFTHNPMEAIQYLKYARGECRVPDTFAPFIFRTEQAPAVDEKLIAEMHRLDFLIVEISSFSRLSCGRYEFQQNYFSENFIRKGGVDYLNWWRDVSQGKPAERSAEDLIQHMNGEIPIQSEEIIRTLTFSELSDDAFCDGIRSLSEVAGVPLVLVPHFSFDEEENAISALRLRNRRLVAAMADELEHDLFDASDLLMQFGREAALKNGGRDLYHYSPEFDAHVGDAMLQSLDTADLAPQASIAAY